MTINCKEYAKQMRENAVKDSNGNIVCSPELWEQIASVIENIPTNTIKRFEKEIRDVNLTLGQTWEIQCAIKKVLKELVGENNE